MRHVLREYLIQADSWLGFSLAPDFTVKDVTSSGPAAAAGLRTGDHLVSLNHRVLASDEDYSLARLGVQPHQKVPVTFTREDREKTAEIEAWNRLDGLLFERLGMTVERAYIGSDFRSRLQVSLVEPGGPAGALGLQRGDLIAAVRPKGLRAKTIGTPEDLAFLVSRMQTGDPIGMEIWRDDDGDGQYERNEDYSELYKGTLEIR